MKFEKSYAIPTKSAPVFDALTSSRHLQIWFAEHAEIGANAGEPFRFWGRHTLWAPEAADANQTLTRLELSRAIGFSWTWLNEPGEVTITVAEDPSGTRVELSHELPGRWSVNEPHGAPRAEHPEQILGWFWDVAMHNLAFYLHQGEPCLRPDYAPDGSQIGDLLRLSLLIEAPAAQIYRALIEPKRMNQWLSRDARVVAERGGEYEFGWTGSGADHRGPRRLVALTRDERVAHDWFWPGEPATLVTWELAANGEETMVTLEHSGLAGADPLYALGWCHALLSLRAAVSPESAVLR